jgi:hypothetical protein
LVRRTNAFRQGSPRGPTAHPLAPCTRRFSVPCWLVYFIAGRVFVRCALELALHSLAGHALPLSNWRTSVTLHELTISFLLFVGAQIALSCGSRLTVSQIWRMSPSRLTG